MSAEEKNKSFNEDEIKKEAPSGDSLLIDYILSKSDNKKEQKLSETNVNISDTAGEPDIIDAVRLSDNTSKKPQVNIPSDTVKSVRQAAKETKLPANKPAMIKDKVIITLGLKLMTIAVVMALILSVVNQLTFRRIESQVQQKKNEAMLKIFKDSEFSDIGSLKGFNVSDKVTSVYKVMRNGAPAGYCINVTSTGFGGAIELIVGVNDNKKVEGIEVISAYETPNIGTKALDKSYLTNFINLLYPISFNATTNQGVNAISGATITSTAVKDGINTALEAAQTVKEAGK